MLSIAATSGIWDSEAQKQRTNVRERKSELEMDTENELGSMIRQCIPTRISESISHTDSQGTKPTNFQGTRNTVDNSVRVHAWVCYAPR